MLSMPYLAVIAATAGAAFGSQIPFADEEQVKIPDFEMPSMSRNTPMMQYVLEVEKEWELDGKTAEWAPSTNGKPLNYGEEHFSMMLSTEELKEDEPWSNSAQMAVSHDGKLMALATNAVIRIYATSDYQLRSELVGHIGNIETLIFTNEYSFSTSSGSPYMLLSQEDNRNLGIGDGTIITWSLDIEGRPLSTTKPVAVKDLASKALSAISGDLTTQHALSSTALDDLRFDILTALKKADTLNRLRSLPSVRGSFPSFGSKFLCKHGSRYLSILNGESTQSGMRSPELLPQIIVRSLETNETVAVLKGHRDAIMWASFSPTNADIIATASWDGEYRIWDCAQQGEKGDHCKTVITSAGKGQQWSGDFSRDGEYVLFAGTSNVAIYSVFDGTKLYELKKSEGQLEDWIRYLEWSPAGDAIALANGSEILLWEPFHKDGNRVSAIVKLAEEKRASEEDAEAGVRDVRFQEFVVVKWLDGNRLAVKTSEESWLVWDREKNWKWRFQRKDAPEGDLYTEGCALLKRGGRDYFVTLDGDREVREWLLE